MEYTLFYLTRDLPVVFQADALGILFSAVITIVWIGAGMYSVIYMKEEPNPKRYCCFYLLVFAVLQALAFAGNLITFYLFYELMTLLSAPLVFNSQTKEAVMAGLKYLFYSFFGAYLALFGFFLLFPYGGAGTFAPGGILTGQEAGGNWVLAAVFCMILGFSVKAGMFPLHGWLPSAHPVAPSPASAVLSAVIVKMGILGIIRTVYYVVGEDLLQGTWVQKAWLILSLITVFMGSALAYWEKQLKKRLAYSTVSQAAYILFGLALLNEKAMTGSLLHVICHAFIKATLFLFAGAAIRQRKKSNVEDLKGIGKEMPLALWCFTFAALGLIGIPPTGGFLSKWYLAVGALESNLAVFSRLGPITLLVSALLTAGYLLPISINGFLPGKEYVPPKRKEPSGLMLAPLLALAFFSVIIGLFPAAIMERLAQITVGLFS